MNLQVHIERLILDGIPAELRDAPLIRAAVEAKLVELFEGDSGIPRINFSSAMSRVRGGAVDLKPDFAATAAATQIAGAIYSGISKLSSLDKRRESSASRRGGNKLLNRDFFPRTKRTLR